MTTTLDAAQVYDRYSALSALAAEWFGGSLGGRLMLYGKADPYGSDCALAGNIAGAATLGVDADAEALKLAIRNSVCDFMVNSLDEALRILKNEIRKKQPVSVCLQQNFSAAVEEMIARGVQPDILALTPLVTADADAIATMRERGAVALPIDAAPHSERSGVSWSVEEFPALWLPKIDVLAAEVCGDEMRGRWLRLAPRYMGRRAHSSRYVEMSAREVEAFAHSIRRSVDQKATLAAVTLWAGGREERIAASA